MKIVLATTPNPHHPTVLQNDFQPDHSAMLTYIPIGLLSLIGALQREPLLHNEVRLYELNRAVIAGRIPVTSQFYQAAAADLCADDPDIVGFMSENETYHHILQICAAIKATHPKCITVLGGPHASAVAAPTLMSWRCIDYIVRGEGEITFPDLVGSISQGRTEPIPGVWSRTTDGVPIFGGHRPLIADLDELPYPAYELYTPDPGEEIFFEVGRGCPFQCTFCSTAPFWERKHRVKSPDRILQELKHVVTLYGARRLHFTHDLFTTDKRWVHAVCDTLIASGAPVQWTCSSRTDTVDNELLAHMARAGCSAIYFGLESGSPRLLRDIKKRINLREAFEIVKQCRDCGITPNVGFIAGLPGEDTQSLSETFDAYATALELGCAPVHLFQYTPFDDSADAPKLTDRTYRGHFLDIPLGTDTDNANRALVGSDAMIFGPYHRPHHRGTVSEELIDGIEQFTPVMSSLLMPTLTIARALGGMFALYERWIGWISGMNDARNAPPYRRCFGTQAQFADFLMDNAERLTDTPPGLISVLQILRTHLQVAAPQKPATGTTMANYKLGRDPRPTIELATTLARGDLLAYLEQDEDVEQLLGVKPPQQWPAPQPERTYWLWHGTTSGDVRLLKVNQFTYRAAISLQDTPMPAADLLVDWSLQHNGDGDERDLFSRVDDLQAAARLGVIHIVPGTPPRATAGHP